MGWNLVLYNYESRPLVDRIQATNAVDDPATQFASVNLSGVGTSVVTALRKDGKYERLHLVGNEFGAGVIAWDLETLQKDKAISVTLLSPKKMNMPPMDQIKKLKGIEVWSAQNDPWSKDPQLDEWIKSNPIPADIGIQSGEVIGYNRDYDRINYKNLAYYLAKRLK